MAISAKCREVRCVKLALWGQVDRLYVMGFEPADFFALRADRAVLFYPGGQECAAKGLPSRMTPATVEGLHRFGLEGVHLYTIIHFHATKYLPDSGAVWSRRRWPATMTMADRISILEF